MKRKLYIKTFGCQMNEYDSARMVDALVECGFELANQPEDADVILVNTCSVREKAQEKLFSQLGRWRPWKQERAGRVLGVGGCVASQEGEALRERAPYVDLVFGPQTLHRLPQMLEEHLRTRRAVVDISFPEIEKFDCLPAPRAEGTTAFVSVMEGCSKYCTFCVVPYTRGEEVSRPFESVLREVRALAAQGVREVTLLGQNVNAYRGMMDDGTEADLALLLHYVAAIEGIGRVRYTTSHPVEFSDSLVSTYAELPQLADHVHLPVQSGSDRVLARMKRGHTVLEYRSLIRRLRQARPTLSLSSDFIVGFPGETEADFRATMDLIEELRFDHAFSFIYSARPGTPAAALPDDVPQEVKEERLARLQSRLNEIAAEFNQAMIGTRQRVLAERVSRKSASELAGRAANNRIVVFPGNARLIGRFVDVRITSCNANSLRGELIAGASTDRTSEVSAANWC
ncbi:MAG: tRNA (N6-isopentenyl adenosine(37)-C2)-methylthiotransferase MiaB [Gammaproteobacteria bacterium]|jgi:tRNA-2-methylthio-N6-dimethylallyladenosine synthase|nr:tRNA (N6-isopentenyl adenosine(37)-C2)-methylthiotransferase MiaB [Gammaproteobacteria bacterium]